MLRYIMRKAVGPSWVNGIELRISAMPNGEFDKLVAMVNVITNFGSLPRYLDILMNEKPRLYRMVMKEIESCETFKEFGISPHDLVLENEVYRICDNSCIVLTYRQKHLIPVE